MLIILDPADLAGYTPTTRAEVLADVARRFGGGAAPPPVAPARPSAPGRFLIRFTVPQAHDFLARLSPRAYVGAAWIAALPAPRFLYSGLVAAVGAQADGGVRGANSALTRAARTATGNTGNKNAVLIDSNTLPAGDHDCWLHPDSHAALRTALAEREAPAAAA